MLGTCRNTSQVVQRHVGICAKEKCLLNNSLPGGERVRNIDCHWRRKSWMAKLEWGKISMPARTTPVHKWRMSRCNQASVPWRWIQTSWVNRLKGTPEGSLQISAQGMRARSIFYFTTLEPEEMLLREKHMMLCSEIDAAVWWAFSCTPCKRPCTLPQVSLLSLSKNSEHEKPVLMSKQAVSSGNMLPWSSLTCTLMVSTREAWVPW